MDESNVSGPFPEPELPDFDAAGRPVPPWVKYPNLRRGSMGWRMGRGEYFLFAKFSPWWRQLSVTEREAYRTEYPSPAKWKGFLDSEVPDFDWAGRLVPPWVKYPRRHRNSAAWRISRCKQFLERFWLWWGSLSIDDREEYRLHYPEPEQWRGFFAAPPKAIEKRTPKIVSEFGDDSEEY